MPSARTDKSSGPDERRTFVLVHGSWHGGWCWRRVAERLREAGHRVYTPTCTGLGERSHLLSRDLTLETFIADVLGVIDCEELDDVVLVGHSFGGLTISGVADRMPERLRHLVFLDAFLVQPGQTPLDGLNPEVAEARQRQADEINGGLAFLPLEPGAFGVTDATDVAWLKRRLTPHPASVYKSPLMIRAPIGHGVACTYISCTDPAYAAFEQLKARVRQQGDWGWREIATGHDAMITAPDAVAEMLLEIAAAHPMTGPG